MHRIYAFTQLMVSANISLGVPLCTPVCAPVPLYPCVCPCSLYKGGVLVTNFVPLVLASCRRGG